MSAGAGRASTAPTKTKAPSRRLLSQVSGLGFRPRHTSAASGRTQDLPIHEEDTLPGVCFLKVAGLGFRPRPTSAASGRTRDLPIHEADTLPGVCFLKVAGLGFEPRTFRL